MLMFYMKIQRKHGRSRLEPNTSSTMVRSANVTVTVYNNFTEDGTATPAVHKHTYHLVITQDKCPGT